MIAQAAHIPVHLGSMPLSVKSAISSLSTDIYPGDMIILNDPFKGGTHLPDITLVSPVFDDCNKALGRMTLFGFVASRAHHADVGGMTPGSMPVAKEIYQEGLIIPPIKIFESGKLSNGIFDLILANVRTPGERAGDIWAQIAANKRGEQRLQEIVREFGSVEVNRYMLEMLTYTERMTRELLKSLPNGDYSYMDYLDNDGISDAPVPIKATISILGDSARVDFSGSAPQQQGSINAVFAITLSAVYYVFRCLIGLDVPNNDGCLAPIEVIAPEGSIVNARHPAPVAGGNVETSQRIVDVLLGAMSKAAPEALPTKNGPSAIHSHMTNTLNTPVEALEYAYPLRVLRYEIRKNSGGAGKYKGGDGIRRDIQVLTEAQITLLTERRQLGPYGLNGGQNGSSGVNIIFRGDEEQIIAGKGTFELQTGEVLSIQTPGGGGFGKPISKDKISID
jgi:N-methylhydantoinase B